MSISPDTSLSTAPDARAEVGPAPAAGDEGSRPEPGARLRTAQLYLAALGYRVAGSRDPAGAVDGVFGHNTRGAVEQFQADQDLEQTGQLDPDTWDALVDAYEEARAVESSAPTTDEGDAMLADRAAADVKDVEALTGDVLDDLEETPLELGAEPPEPA